MSTTENAAGSSAGSRARLESWKSIGDFLRVNERTAKRWEKERGLPVHRLPGASRSCVFAYAAEIESWRNSCQQTHPGSDIGVSALPPDSDPQSHAEDVGVARPVPSRRLRTAQWLLAAGLTAIIALLAVAAARKFPGEFFRAVAAHASPAPGQVHSPDAQKLYLRGRYYWNLRTADGLATAMDAYTQAIVLDPSFADAYAGLAETYDLLPQFGRADLRESLIKAEAAADRAIALNPNSAEAHAAKGFALFFGEWDISGSDAEFRRALALRPDSDLIHQWYASTLECSDNGPEALSQIETARRLNPTSPAIATDAALFQAEFGDYDAGTKALQEIERTQPSLATPAWFLENLAFATGDYPAYIAEAHRYASTTHAPEDASRADAVARGWARGGRIGLLQAMAASLKASLNRRTHSNYNSDVGFRLGQILILLNRPAEGLPYFREAFNAWNVGLVGMEDCPWARPLQRDPGYAALFADIRRREHGAPAHPPMVRVGLRLPQ